MRRFKNKKIKKLFSDINIKAEQFGFNIQKKQYIYMQGGDKSGLIGMH